MKKTDEKSIRHSSSFGQKPLNKSPYPHKNPHPISRDKDVPSPLSNSATTWEEHAKQSHLEDPSDSRSFSKSTSVTNLQAYHYTSPKKTTNPESPSPIRARNHATGGADLPPLLNIKRLGPLFNNGANGSDEAKDR
jgi:hypothetical protein